MTDLEKQQAELQATVARVLGAERYARAVGIIAMVRSLVDGDPPNMAITLVEAIVVFATAQSNMASALDAARKHIEILAELAPTPVPAENFS